MNPNEASDNKTYNITQIGTTVLPGRFVLVRLVINTKGASSNTAAIYDSDETVGANVERLKGTLDTTDSARSIEYGFPMFTGIYIVVSAGTAANITVVYKATP